MPRRSRLPRRATLAFFEPLEPRQLLSANLVTAFALGTTSPYGQYIANLAIDSSGNLLVTGAFAGTLDVDPSAGTTTFVTNNTYSYDIFLCKYSPSGVLLWADDLGENGFMGNDLAADILVDSSDNILLAGTFYNTIDMDPGAGTTNLTSQGNGDIFVAKYDPSGGLLWAHSYGGTGDDYAGKIVSDARGGCYVSGDIGIGTFAVYPPIPWHCVLMHLDANGNTVWTDQFPVTTDMSIVDIAANGYGGLYIVGSMTTATDLDPGSGKRIVKPGMFLAKYNAAGKLSWARHWSGVFIPSSLALDPKRNIILGGSFGGTADFDPGSGVHTISEQQSPDGFTGFVIRLDSAGGYKWAHAFTGDWWSDVYDVATDATGGIYVTGEFNGTHNFDINSSGQTADTLTSVAQDDAFLAKYDTAGHLSWLQTVASTGYDHGQHIVVGPANRVFLTGYFNNTAHFGPAAPPNAGLDITAIGTNDSFVAIFDQSPATPTVTLAAQIVRASHWHNYRITITVAPPQGVAAGKVVLMDGTRVLGRGTLDVNGRWTVRVNNLATGVHTLTASYSGSNDLTPTTSSGLLLTVARPV